MFQELGSLETAHYFEVTISLSPAALGQNKPTQDFSKARLSFTCFISPADTMSFVESLQAAQQTLSTALAQQASPFIINQHKIAQCLALMSDELSKVNYQSEISYLMLRDINKPLAAQISPFTEADWKHVVERWQGFVKSPECPKMVCAQGEQGYMANMLMTTFIAGQYRYNDEVKVAKDEIFVDCGACFGDTALWAYQQGAAEVYSFEPSPYNFAVLERNIEANNHDKSKCFNLAVGEAKGKLSFAAAPGMAGASHADAHGNIQVDCVVLDDFFAEHNIKPTFLKFDIEGAEYGALKGCRKTITELKPKLTVCLYHQISDMWKLPLLIHEMVPEYRFYCRKNNVHNEFILYATI